ncbi:MAG TPA: transcriptional repressor, partial [Candidatus Dormibacteraeota bacterium]|nr:transcriptional repressor [Candidatus Dormibacteraeota bacterium]
FEEPRIEHLQEETAKRLGFQFTGHKMELYGVCRDCRRSRAHREAS